MATESDANINNPVTDDAALRIGEDDRQQALQRLRTATADGLLTLDEFGERTAGVLAATTNGDIARILADLPAQQSATPATGRGTGLIIGIFGGGDRRGRWRLAERCTVINVFGGAELDLRGVKVEAPVSTLIVLSLFGGSKILVPPGIEVDAGGLAIFGGNDTDLQGLRPEPGAPVVRIQSYSLFGGTDVSVRLSG